MISIEEAALLGLNIRRQELAEKIRELKARIGDKADLPIAYMEMFPQESRQAPKKPPQKETGHSTPATKRKLSPEGRRRIIEATKKRWARYRAQNNGKAALQVKWQPSMRSINRAIDESRQRLAQFAASVPRQRQNSAKNTTKIRRRKK